MNHILKAYTLTDRNAFNFSMGVLYGEVVEEEHAVEWFYEELDLITSQPAQ
jgi:hypothetical protein